MTADITGFPKGIKYVSLADSTGYAVAAKRYLRGLMKTNIPLTWTPMVSGMSWGLGYQPFSGNSIGDADLDMLCNRQIEYDTVILHLMPDYYPFWIKMEAGKRIIGYTVWETDKIPHHWKPLLNSVDGLMVPCQWNKRVFEQGGVTAPIRVIPHIAEPPCEPTQLRNKWGIPDEDFVFYTTNVWSERKNLPKLIEAYLQTFQASDPVTLLIKSSIRDDTKYKPGLFWLYCQSLTVDSVRASVNTIRQKYSSPARIKLIARHLKDIDMQSIHQRGDCYVSLCRSEGWGLGAFDAAALCKPIIITGYGGQLDYLPPDLSYLVDFRLIPVQTQSSSYTSDQYWAEPDVEHAANRMREVYNNKEEARKRGKVLANNISQFFNEEIIMNKLLDALREDKK